MEKGNTNNTMIRHRYNHIYKFYKLHGIYYLWTYDKFILNYFYIK